MNSGWRATTLGEFIQLQRGHDLPTQSRNVGTIPVLGANGPVGSHDSAIDAGPGVLLGRAGHIGKATFWPGPYWPLNTSLYVKDFRGNDPLFTYYLLDSIEFRSFNSGGAQPMLNRNFIAHIGIYVPPVTEQRRIAGILRTWDDAIESNVELIAASRSKFEQLRSDLIGSASYQQPVPQSKPLAEVSERVRRTNDGVSHPVMTISAKSGFILQTEKYSRDMAGMSVNNYTLLRQGEFAYNKGNSLTYPQGCVFSMPHESALVPNVYISFQLNEGLNHRYFEHVFASGYLNSQLARLINSGVRNDGLLNLNTNDFFRCEVPVPSSDDQELFADILDEGRREIELLTELGNKLSIQKRGLMQQLLTGEIRVTDRVNESLGEAAVV